VFDYDFNMLRAKYGQVQLRVRDPQEGTICFPT
jgi:hypothetical protein